MRYELHKRCERFCCFFPDMAYLHSALWVFVLGHVILASPVEKKEYMVSKQVTIQVILFEECIICLNL